MAKPITREQAEDMAQAHAEGLHAELPREGCPECEDRPLGEYPRYRHTNATATPESAEAALKAAEAAYRETPKRLQGLRDYTPEAP